MDLGVLPGPGLSVIDSQLRLLLAKLFKKLLRNFKKKQK